MATGVKRSDDLGPGPEANDPFHGIDEDGDENILDLIAPAVTMYFSTNVASHPS